MELPSFDPFTPAGVVADAGAQLGTLDGVLWAAKTPAELVGTVEELETLRSRVAALEASVLAEIAAQKIARTHLGWGSTGDWYTHLAGTHRTDGSRTVRQSGPLVDEFPATHAALREGAVSPEQAAVIVDAIGKLPHNAALRERGEAVLLEAAGRLNATDLARAARHLLEVIDPDRTDRDAEKALDRADRAAHLGRYLSITEDGAGGVRLRGRGTLEDAATLKAALLPLTAPVPATDPVTGEENKDPRDHGARLWDALVGLAEHALTTDLPPDSHGTRPRVSITISLDALPPVHDRSPSPAIQRPRQPCSRADRDRIDWATLGTWTGLTEDGLELSPATVRRLACDADLIPIALGTTGEVLDVGRLHRLVTPALWRALVCRDRHCAFPGCTRPPAHVPRPPHRALAPRRHHQAPQPGPALRPPPPPHPPHPLASPHRDRRTPRVPPTPQTRTTTRLDPTPPKARVSRSPERSKPLRSTSGAPGPVHPASTRPAWLAAQPSREPVSRQPGRRAARACRAPYPSYPPRRSSSST